MAQVQLLSDRIEEIPGAEGVQVASVDSFQGREADAVVISMVLPPLTPEGPRIHGSKMTNLIDRIVKNITQMGMNCFSPEQVQDITCVDQTRSKNKPKHPPPSTPYGPRIHGFKMTNLIIS